MTNKQSELQQSLFSNDRVLFSNAPSLKQSMAMINKQTTVRLFEDDGANSIQNSQIVTEREDSSSIDILPFLQTKNPNTSPMVVDRGTSGVQKKK